MKLCIRYKKLHPDAVIPTSAHGGKYPDSGYDLFSIKEVVVNPHSSEVIPTGIAIELPKPDRAWVEGVGWLNMKYEAQIRPRSSHRLYHNLVVSLGTIDCGYRGDVGVIVHNQSNDVPYVVKKGEKIAQLVIGMNPEVEWLKTDGELASTSRGQDGFGSTGNA
ncbi:MAG: dUTP diphosphatase [Candidatus Saccharimonadales bacterium]